MVVYWLNTSLSITSLQLEQSSSSFINQLVDCKILIVGIVYAGVLKCIFVVSLKIEETICNRYNIFVKILKSDGSKRGPDKSKYDLQAEHVVIKTRKWVLQTKTRLIWPIALTIMYCQTKKWKSDQNSPFDFRLCQNRRKSSRTTGKSKKIRISRIIRQVRTRRPRRHRSWASPQIGRGTKTTSRSFLVKYVFWSFSLILDHICWYLTYSVPGCCFTSFDEAYATVGQYFTIKSRPFFENCPEDAKYAYTLGQ